MRVAVISDIHGNLHALSAVLSAIEREQPDSIWCLGDLVGYGPRPSECCESVQAVASLCLCGNHDLGVLGRLELDEFSPDAAAAALWTREILTEDARNYLDELAPSAKRDGVELHHGSPRDPVWEYILSTEAARAALELAGERIVLVGHSHVPLALVLNRGRLGGGLAPDGSEASLRKGRWLLNPGSVGQPRDGDPRAAWLLLDLDARQAFFRREEYPIAETQAEIREAGLPAPLGERLAEGV
jgi:diadenosine tetraphosphatase ApaH/serine/threonine PP2A family protein phosphatase